MKTYSLFIFYFLFALSFFYSQNKDSLILIRFPIISQEPMEDRGTSKENRYIFIDCNANPEDRTDTNLYKKSNGKLVLTRHLPKGGTFSVLVSNFPYSYSNSVKLKVQNEVYAYNHDFKNLYSEISNTDDSSDKNNLSAQGTLQDSNTDTNSLILNDYLKTVFENFDHDYMNITDFQEVQNYKQALTDSIKKHRYSLSPSEKNWVAKILQYYPKALMLTPFSILIEDVDAIQIELELDNDSSKKIPVARYEVSHSLAVRMNTNLFLSGLTTSDEVYFEETEEGEKYVKLEKPDKSILGLGLNAEVSYLTGGMLRPTMNFGFMLPLGQEDLTPYFTMGPGISYGTARVRLALSGGWAFGKVNQIKDRYKGEDISSIIEDTPTYTESGWKSSWQISLGLGFNLY